MISDIEISFLTVQNQNIVTKKYDHFQNDYDFCIRCNEDKTVLKGHKNHFLGFKKIFFEVGWQVK